MSDNPYKSPIGVERATRAGGADNRAAFGVVCFWLAMLFTTVGIVSVFIRNSPPLGWFLLGSTFFVGGVVVSKGRYRRMAAVGLILCLLAAGGTALNHYQLQLEREKYQKMRDIQRNR